MKNQRFLDNYHYFTLGAILLLAFLLRWHNLDLKPLWLDEIITALFASGQNYENIPRETVLPIQEIPNLFTWQRGVSCPQIAANLAQYSTHPPLFFCLLYGWLGWWQSLTWVIQLRSLSVLFGVAGVFVIYFVNRLAFSRGSGLMAALLMAVSPFAVYLSQEARHYTLPMLLISLSLWGLIQIQTDIFQAHRHRLGIWIVWSTINAISLYVHYFCLLAVIAEITTILLCLWWHRKQLENLYHSYFYLFASSLITCLSFLPWLFIMWQHSYRAETQWIGAPNLLSPFYNTLLGWVLMVIAFPVENQHLAVTICSTVVVLLTVVAMGIRGKMGYVKLWQQPVKQIFLVTLSSCICCVLLQLFALSYFRGKDITSILRYNFIYYPYFCALLGACLHTQVKSPQDLQKKYPKSSFFANLPIFATPLFRQADITFISFQHPFIFVCLGLISSLFVTNNLVFHKPFYPEQVARNLTQEIAIPLTMVMVYSNEQDIALGLSFALALQQHQPTLTTNNSIFLPQQPDWQTFAHKLKILPFNSSQRLNLWIFAPGRRRREYPPQLLIDTKTSCSIDIQQHYRIGIPYQLYRCATMIK
ncbi:glycosyltransferase family 39 protein [Calothrix sp. 336/3]|uniref:glycosyltransferase family 39 protein n=1 Tax=Calothrix sp. 336/3 TaxID=1337936 RepID=UPI0004E3008B|nr:glycosyltransferase family 39 protein [Calothrix sp. 336/3]AKG21870.1 hypothetical protein IJ00_11900 [Calothrix sp. 336/3]